MSKYVNVAMLVTVLLLGFLYGQERDNAARKDEQLHAFRVRLDSLTSLAASRLAAVAVARGQSARSDARARSAVQRRDRVVASSDSVLVRLDTTSLSVSQDTLAPVVLALRTVVLTERSAASVAIASLEQSVSAQSALISALDSALVVRSAQVETLTAALRVASQPVPLYLRLASGATKVAIGLVIGFLLR